MMSVEKVNAVVAQGSTSRTFEIEYEEETKYLDLKLADF